MDRSRDDKWKDDGEQKNNEYEEIKKRDKKQGGMENWKMKVRGGERSGETRKESRSREEKGDER